MVVLAYYVPTVTIMSARVMSCCLHGHSPIHDLELNIVHLTTALDSSNCKALVGLLSCHGCRSRASYSFKLVAFITRKDMVSLSYQI